MLNDWLVWKPGNENQILFGKDPLIGSRNYYKLSDGLINFLHSIENYYLAQIGKDYGMAPLSQNWKFATDLGIPSTFKEEWKKYITGLNFGGFILTEDEDQLLWS